MTTTRERILQKLNPKLLKMTPKLSVENGSFVNLDSDDPLEEGAKQLMIRFWRNQDLGEKNKRNSSSETEVTVTSAKYNEGNEICEILTERLKLPCSTNEDDDLCDRPGKNLQLLKMQLQEKMSAKWEEEYKKRVSENKLNKGHKSKHKEKECSDEGENSDEDSDPGDCSEDDEDKQKNDGDDGCDGDVEDEDEQEEEEEEEQEEVEDIRKDSNSVTEADEPGTGETAIKNPSKGSEYDDIESCSLPPAYQPGGGLLYGGSELTQHNEDLPQNLLSPSLKFSIPESPQSKSLSDSTPSGKETITAEELNNSFSMRNKLFSQNPNESFDLNDAYEFCSGKFPDECSNSQPAIEASSTQVSEDANDETEEATKDEDEGDVDGNEDEENDEISDDKSEDEDDNDTKNGPKVRKKIITFDDSEDDNHSIQQEAEEPHEVSKILSDDEEALDDKTKRRRKTLRFSDDENDDVEERESEEEEEEEEEVEEVEERDEERSVHYDSEENEIINPREFFEKEAELSGSERSEDEDERGLDEFDAEEGDADNLDSDQVRSQLEKIHLRQLLDEDAREVRLIQEILFEDGDLHSDGKGRDRKFRWKNLGGAFEENGEPETKEEGANSSEDEGAEEELLRKLRHERELFLMEKKKNGDDDSGDEIIENFQSIKVTSVKSSVKISAAENSKTILDYAEIGKVTVTKARGSFLTRNEEFLSRLAKVTSSISDNVLGPKHSKNFVFVSKSPEKVEPNKSTGCKRQVDDVEVSGRRRDKKFKILPPDVDTGPSIVDLLL